MKTFAPSKKLKDDINVYRSIEEFVSRRNTPNNREILFISYRIIINYKRILIFLNKEDILDIKKTGTCSEQALVFKEYSRY